MPAAKLSITLDQEVATELNALANELQEKKSHIIQKALTLYMDYLDERVADKRLDDLENGHTKTVPADEVYAKLGL